MTLALWMWTPDLIPWVVFRSRFSFLLSWMFNIMYYYIAHPSAVDFNLSRSRARLFIFWDRGLSCLGTVLSILLDELSLRRADTSEVLCIREYSLIFTNSMTNVPFFKSWVADDCLCMKLTVLLFNKFWFSRCSFFELSSLILYLNLNFPH